MAQRSCGSVNVAVLRVVAKSLMPPDESLKIPTEHSLLYEKECGWRATLEVNQL
jgi:hypothetical protein